jgi:tetratricopeptide (TPR) repeat protein
MNQAPRIAAVFSCLLALSVLSHAQFSTDPFSAISGTTSGTKSYESQGAVLVLTVYGENHKVLDRQSVIKLENTSTHSTMWQTTTDKSEAYFVDLSVGQYEMEVSAVGYLTVHKPYSVGSAYTTFHSEITLQRDPAAITLTEPNAPDLPGKVRKQTQRGVRALKAGRLKEAQKQLEEAYKVVPNSADLNFLLGYVYFQNKDYAQAQNFLAKAVTANHHNPQALTLLGRVRLQRGEIDAARATLEDAVAADPDYWMAHNLLAEAYFQSHDYEKSCQQAQIAIDRSKGAGNTAQLVLGQALAHLHRNDEAIAALETFLRNVPGSPTAAQVRDLINQLKTKAPVQTAAIDSAPAISAGPLIDDSELRLSIKTWEPPGVDDSKATVSAGVACPQGQVISEAGARVKELVGDISRFAAVEELLHENVDELGNAITKETRHYNYLAAISEAKPGYLEVEEYRTEHSEIPQFPDNMVSRGFPTLAFVFHPALWDNFEFSCEGMGELHGHPTWLVHFRQRDDRPNRIHDFKIGGMIYSVNLKGRAWITPDKFQIVRIESELVKPMPQIQLLTEHQIVEYGPVQFGKKNVELWLPKSAELYFDFRKRRIYRKHSFDHFMLFSTETDEKVGGPKQDPKVPAQTRQENPQAR